MADREKRPRIPGIRGKYDYQRENYVDKTLRWRDLKKPTIAAVQGYCIFGGWIFASAMDVIFAADDAMFLASNFQYFSVPWDLHPRMAKEILFQGRFLSAEDARELNLVNRVVPRAELVNETLAYAADVAKNDPFYLRMAKLAVNQMQDTQGFHAHITSGHLMFLTSLTGEQDEDYALNKPDGRRRPMVQRAMENFKAYQEKKH